MLIDDNKSVVLMRWLAGSVEMIVLSRVFYYELLQHRSESMNNFTTIYK